METVLINADVYTPFRVIEKGVLRIVGGKIIEVGSPKDVAVPENAEVIDLEGKIVAPGFVDLLIHGAMNYGFTDDAPEAIETISDYFWKHGHTTLMASLHAKPKERLLKNIERIAKHIDENPESNIKGIHMEGPYLNVQYKGAMNAEYLWTPSVESWKEMWEASRGHIKLMTVAPELPGAIDVIRAAANDGVVISIGHSKATLAEVDVAIDNGAAQVTHMFNAMDPIHHRRPGVALAALLRKELKIGLIADTHHVHGEVMDFLLDTKKSNGIILVSDSTKPGGLPEGTETEFSHQKVIIKNGLPYLTDGTLAGSSLTLNRAVKNVVEKAGASISDGLRMASLNGAKVLNRENKIGIISAGKNADLVVLEKDFSVHMTIAGGKIRYKA